MRRSATGGDTLTQGVGEKRPKNGEFRQGGWSLMESFALRSCIA